MPSQLTPPSGSASISGIVVLENPRQHDDSLKTLLFDAHLFCAVKASLKTDVDNEDEDDGAKKSDTAGILASLRYFNSRDLSFDKVDAYFITANVSLHLIV